jgi:predicted DNA-binding transcriptional regulator AlpA
MPDDNAWSAAMTSEADLINEIEAARMRGQSVRTLQMERLRGSGCRYVKLGRSVRYRRGDVLAYINSRIVTSTTEADALRAAHG